MLPEHPGPSEHPSRRSSSASTPPPSPSSETQPSKRSTREIIRQAGKQHGIAAAGGGGVTVVAGITYLAQLLESMGKIQSASGIQFGAFAATAIVLIAVYLARQEQRDAERREWQEQRDAEERAERERTRQAYHDMIEAREQRHREENQDAHADLVTQVGKLTAKVDALNDNQGILTGEVRVLRKELRLSGVIRSPLDTRPGT